MDNNPIQEQEKNEIKLYTLLIDELFRHQTNIWQIPTALLSVNLIAIYYFKSECVLLTVVLMVLWLFNAGLIFVFYQMVKAQMKIIGSIKEAEGKLGLTFPMFLPKIKEPPIKSPWVFLVILILLEFILAGYILLMCSSCFYLLIARLRAC
ncbi:MAG: hypothetical protein ABR936_15510 [Bacteroidota bacterium]|jgi:hypothetical protein